MFEKIKENLLLNKLQKVDNGRDLVKIIDKNKDQISENFNAYLIFLEKCIEIYEVPRKYVDYFQELFNKYYLELEKKHSSLLFQMLENNENRINPFTDIFLNRDIFPSLTKELRLKILSSNFFSSLIYGFNKSVYNIDDLILTDDLIEIYKTNEILLEPLKERLKSVSDEDLIKYISFDENIALYVSYEKVANIINKISLSNNIVYELYKENPSIIQYVQNDYNSLFELIKAHPKEIQNILKEIDSQNMIKIYNLDPDFFNSSFLENPLIFNDNTSLTSYILIHNPDIMKQLMNLHFYDANSEYSDIFGTDFFLRDRTYNNILTNYGADKFIEFLKLYPLFGATEKSFNPGKQGRSVYGEQQFFNNVHYNLSDGNTISIDDACKLIDIDINYLFCLYSYWPDDYYLSDDYFDNPYHRNYSNETILKQNILSLLQKKLVENGLENNFEKLLPSFNIIFDNLYKKNVLSEKTMYQSFSIYKYELIKMLFNTDILRNNTAEDINLYIESCYKDNKGNQELFYKIFENAYGNKALQIIKSRPGLDPYTINSFEIFRPEIIDNFREGFVHDLLSYNIKGFSNFLMISKNAEELSLFIDYYNCLAKIFGENVMTMEKSFVNFYYYKDLIKDIQNVDLTEEEQKNFVSVISGNYNNCNISSRKDLIKYNEIANKSLLESIRKAKTEIECKNIICNDLFGIDYGIIRKSYKFAIDQLSLPSNASLLSDSLDESERNIMQFLSFLCNDVVSMNELHSLVENLINLDNVRYPKSCVSLLNKIRVFEIKQVNERLMTDKAINELISNGSLKKMDEYEGVPIYCYSELDKSLYKINDRLLDHTTPLNKEQMNNLEPDNGVSTISTWFQPKSEYKGRPTEVYFYQIPEDTQIVAAMPYDGQTSKLAKGVYAQGIKGKMGYSSEGMFVNCGNSENVFSEVAFYRRHRDHNNITNENHGGLIVPNCFANISLKTIEKAKNCNGIIICSYDDYSKFIEGLNNEKEAKGL